MIATSDIGERTVSDVGVYRLLSIQSCSKLQGNERLGIRGKKAALRKTQVVAGDEDGKKGLQRSHASLIVDGRTGSDPVEHGRFEKQENQHGVVYKRSTSMA